MGVQTELLKTAGGLATAVSALAESGEDIMKSAEKEAGSLAIRGEKPKVAPKAEKQPKQEDSKPEAKGTKVQQVEEASKKSKDAVKAALLQKRQTQAKYLNTINRIRREIKKEVTK